MHLLIAFAYCNSEGCARAVQDLRLPHLEKLLQRLTPRVLDDGDASSYSPPHERALASALGLPLRDGEIPWAAWRAHPQPGRWGFVSPCHWVMGSDDVAMSVAPLADFPAQESQALLASMQPFFAEDGIELIYDQPLRWLARGNLLQGIVSASEDRVAGRGVKDWLPRGAGAASLRRLQTEMQMLCYHHPVNDQRQARGVALVNSFWISGTGALRAGVPAPGGGADPRVVSELREPALQGNWAAWAQAWQALDRTHCAALLDVIEACSGATSELARCTLSLCGERNALTFDAVRPRFLREFLNRFSQNRSSDVLGKL